MKTKAKDLAQKRIEELEKALVKERSHCFALENELETTKGRLGSSERRRAELEHREEMATKALEDLQRAIVAEVSRLRGVDPVFGRRDDENPILSLMQTFSDIHGLQMALDEKDRNLNNLTRLLQVAMGAEVPSADLAHRGVPTNGGGPVGEIRGFSPEFGR